MSSEGAAPRAAVPVSNARAEASRKNGAKSRGPTTPEGKARSAQNALKHGLRAQKYVVLPQEDAAEFEALQAALVEELAPQGVLQRILVGRIAVAAWRLQRAERLEVEVLEFRSYQGAGPGVALMRDGNGTRSIETLLRYRGAAVAEFMRSLRTLKALQAEQAAGTGPSSNAHAQKPARRPPLAQRPQPNQPERGAQHQLEYALPEPPAPGRTLHESAAPRMPNEPGSLQRLTAGPTRPACAPNEPEPHRVRAPDRGKTTPPPAPARSAMRATDSQGRMDRLNKCRTHG